VSTIPPVVKNNSHHGISTIKSDYPKKQTLLSFLAETLLREFWLPFYTTFSILLVTGSELPRPTPKRFASETLRMMT
jgi:hypothetical protein